jgi:hypothetical protein
MAFFELGKGIKYEILWTVVQGAKHVNFFQSHFALVLNKYCRNDLFFCLRHSFLIWIYPAMLAYNQRKRLHQHGAFLFFSLSVKNPRYLDNVNVYVYAIVRNGTLYLCC